MNFAELTSKFQARGFDYLDSERSGDFLNDAYLIDICDAEDWPFLEASAEGPAPLTISDLGHIEEVVNPSGLMKLEPLQRSRISDADVELATAGTPELYFLTGGDVVNAYPTSSESLLVRYFKTPARLTGTTEPIIPSRFHSLIIDGAVARAYEDSDDYELAENAETKFQRRLQKMREALLFPQHDAPDDFVAITDPDVF